MGSNAIGEDACDALHDSLVTDTSLTVLELRNGGISDVGCKRIGAALQINQRLTYLDLSRNPVGDSGLTALAVGLSCPTSAVSSLDVNSCLLCGGAAEALATSLQASMIKLRHLNLGNNRLTSPYSSEE